MLARQYLLIGGALTVLSACKPATEGSGLREQQPTQLPAASNDAQFDPLARVDAYMRAWSDSNGVPDAAIKFFHPTKVKYFDASVGKTKEGLDEASAVVRNFMIAAKDVKWRRDMTKAPVVQGDTVVYQWTFCGTNTGEILPKVKPSGKRFRFSGVTIMRFEGDLITEQSDFYDALGFFSQLGYTAPTPEATPPPETTPAAEPAPAEPDPNDPSKPCV
jgi:hypothetical protein